MKKVIFLILVVLGTTVHAQRKAGGWAIQARYGLMEGKGQMNSFFGAFPEGQATSGQVGVNLLIGNKGLMAEANLFMNDYFVDTTNFNLPYRLYGLNALGGWSYEGFRKLYLNLKAGAFAGIERINDGNDRENITGGKYRNSVAGLTYGIILNPELEIVLYRKLSLTISSTQYWHPSNKWTRFQHSGDIGLKYYL
ncbi:hypothetical protein CAPN002_26080 [Capnocytophaga stomatis]|uniref:hypothetical protein n=1 Tax=Capnocytophaga stomatis TaxID=1848904 RepID=UPI00194FD3CC|nr:hypothetical protein [Capnocytophaga stomatis]GIJ95390.1 hypothetical protein CAPN002_26080 [Capnocytophaga stomatis]